MGKISFLSVILFCLVFSSSAQDVNEEVKTSIFERKHELRLGAVKLLSGGILETSYEYILDKNQGLGAYLLINFYKNNDWFENYSLTPYYRMYFQTNEDYGAKGFFVEGFTSFFLSDFELMNTIENEDSDSEAFDIAIGLSLGKKWINTAGFVFEIKIGAGRNMLNNVNFDAIIKGDFYIGYRF